MKRVLPWLIAATGCLVAAWSLSRPSGFGEAPGQTGAKDRRFDEPGSDTDGGARSAPEDPAVTPLRATQACLARLDVAQTALSRCRGMPREGTPSTLECLAEPEVVSVIEQRIDAAILDHIETERDRHRQARELERTAFDAWAADALRLTPDEGQWLEEYVCAARELREHTLASLEDAPPTEALDQLKQQREHILEDMKEALGPDRYARLRAIGGIGLIADTTDCP